MSATDVTGGAASGEGAALGKNLLLRASAGTGKTYQLVERYAEMVLERGLSPAQVVVITFTRKAAAELRQRIERRLQAGGADGATLAALPSAPIDNFHGLCLRLLAGGFATLPVGPPQPDVLGEAGEDVELFVAATQAAWLTEPALAEDVARVAGRMDVDEAALGRLWSALARAREDGRPVDGALWGADYDAEAAKHAAHAELVARRQEVADGAELLTTPVARAALAAFLAVPVPEPTAALAPWAAGWRAAWAKLSRRGQLRHLLDDEALRAARALPDACLAEASCALLQPSWRRLLDAAWQAYVAAKVRQHSRDFGDIVGEVVGKLESDASMHRAVRRAVRAVLVDEAQDTNRQQRRLVHLLVGLAGPAASEAAPARLLVVGDWKQCIYTFRGADPDNFRHFADDVARTGGTDETLAQSFRSRPALVAAINALGRHLFGGAYEPLEARLPPGSQDAPSAPATAGATPPLADGLHWLAVTGAEGGAPTLADEASRTADVVAQTLAQGVAPHEVAVLLAGLRGQAPAYADALAARGIDCMVTGGGALYARDEVRHLLSLLAWLADEAYTLQAAVALRSPLFTLPDEALWALLSPAGRAQANLAALRRGDVAPTLALLGADATDEACRALAHAAEVLPSLVTAVRASSPVPALHALVDGLDVQAQLCAGEQAPQRLANLARLEKLAERAERQHLPTAAFALQQLGRMQSGTPEAEGAVPGSVQGAVSLSTVHKSKGLQWPVVVLAGLNRGQSGRTSPLLYHRRHGLVFAPLGPQGTVKCGRFLEAAAASTQDDAEQLRRLLYVAVTRAQRRAICVAPATIRGAARGFYSLLTPWQQASPPELQLAAPESVPSAVQALPPTATPAQAARDAEGLEASYAAVRAPRALPQGTTFHLTVTELARFAQAPHDAHGTLQPASTASPPARRRPQETPLATQVAQAVAGETLVAHDPRALGTLVHELLAHWPAAPAADQVNHTNAEAADDVAYVEGWLQHRGLAPASPMFAQLRQDVLAFGKTPLGQKLRALPGAERRHELPFTLARTVDGVVGLLRGQIDLLCWDEGAPWVVDFKYAFPSADPSAYLRQLDAYAWAASELCGHRGPVRCALVYLREAGAATHHVATVARQRAVAEELEAWLRARRHAPRSPSA